MADDRSVKIRLEVESKLGDAARAMKEVATNTKEAASAEKEYVSELEKAVRAARFQRDVRPRIQAELQARGLAERPKSEMDKAIEQAQKRREIQEEMKRRGLQGEGFGMMGAMRLALGGGAIIGGTLAATRWGTRVAETANNPLLTASERSTQIEQSIPIWGDLRKSFVALRDAVNGTTAVFAAWSATNQIERGIDRAQFAGESRTRSAYLEGQEAVRRGAAYGDLLGSYQPRMLSPENTPAAEMANMRTRLMNPAELARARAQAELAAARRYRRDLAGGEGSAEDMARRNLSDAERDLKRLGPVWPKEFEKQFLGKGVQTRVGGDWKIARGGTEDVGRALQEHAGVVSIVQDEVLTRQAQLQEVLNQKKKSSLDIAQKEAEVRKAELGVLQAQAQVLQNKAARAGGIEHQVGMMTEAEKIGAQAVLNRAKQFGLGGLAPEDRSLAMSLAPGYFGREAERRGAADPLGQRIKQLEGLGSESAQQLRKEAIQIENQITIQAPIDEAKLASEIAKAVSQLAKELIQEIRAQMRVEKQKAMSDVIAGQRAQAGGST